MTSTVGAAALAAGLAVHARLLERLRSANEGWWFGYARDGVSLTAVLMLSGAYALLGLSQASALLGGMLTALVVHLLDWAAHALAPHRRGRARLLLAVPLGTWLLLTAFAPQLVSGALNHLIAIAQPRQ